MDKTISLAALSCAVTLCLSSPSYAKIGSLGSNANPASTAQEYQSAQEALQNAKQHFVSKRFDLAFLELLPLAQQGNPDAQYGVGYLYYYGKGTPTNHDKGIYWIRQSAAQGFNNAQKALQMLNLANADTQASPLPQAKIQVKEAPVKQARTNNKRPLRTSFKQEPRQQKITIAEDDLTAELEGSIFGDELTSDLLVDDFAGEGFEESARRTLPNKPQAKLESNKQVASTANKEDNKSFNRFFKKLAETKRQQAAKAQADQEAAAAAKVNEPTDNIAPQTAKTPTVKQAAASNISSPPIKQQTITEQNLAQAETIAQKDQSQIVNNATLDAVTAKSSSVKIIKQSSKNVDRGLIQRAGSIVTYGPTREIDTLWSIARAVRPNKSVSIQQMMLSILEANPKAFNTPNINALKENVILKIPDLSKVEDLDKNQSLARAQQHELDWYENI